MSSCSCSNPKHLRVSDEGGYVPQGGGWGGYTDESKNTHVRLRCLDCAGKAGFLPIEHPLPAHVEIPEEIDELPAFLRQAATPGTLGPTLLITASVENSLAVPHEIESAEYSRGYRPELDGFDRREPSLAEAKATADSERELEDGE